jgi:hypothetical protein
MQNRGDSRVTDSVTVLSPAPAYNRSMHISRLSAIAPAAAAVATLLTGCGDSNKPPTASLSSHSSGIQSAYEFSACMRQHGVPNFPDPVVRTSGNSQSVGIKVTPSETGSPAFNSAQKACAGILPAPPSRAQQAARLRFRVQHLVAFAACMRSHGINGFPDPTAQGQIPPTLLSQAGIDIHLPKVIAAARACVPSSGGILTQAAISQATGSGSGTQSGGG